MSLLYDFMDVLDGSESAPHPRHKLPPTETRIAGIVLYSLLFILTIANYIYKRVKARGSLSTMAKTFFICLPTFMLLRIVWLIDNLVLESHKSVALDRFDSILNRICMCVFLFAFNSMLFYWIDTSLTTVNSAFAKEAFGGSMEFGFMTPLGRGLFYGATGLVIALVLILCVARVILQSELHSSDSDFSEKNNVIHNLNDANNMIISIMFLIFGFLFLFFGVKLNLRISGHDHKLKDLWKTLLFSISLCVCFFIRFVFFSLRIMTDGITIDDNVFIIFTYFVPELIPALLILWSCNIKMFNDSDSKQEKPEDTFVDPLLEEIRDDEMREPMY